MRTPTVLGIFISLAAGMIIGWMFSNTKEDSLPKNNIVATKDTLEDDSNNSHELSELDEQLHLKRAELLIHASRPSEALTLLEELSPHIDLRSHTGQEWLQLLVNAYTATGNQEQLTLIFDRLPSAFYTNEQAALLVADNLIAQQNTQDYRTLQAAWQGRGSNKMLWIFLDAQEKIIDGKPDEAIALLDSIRFRGKDETNRLVRLAALYVVNDPKKAWSYLSEAVKSDPHNPDIHTFRASIGERLNNSEMARDAYLVALQNDPENPFRREQLADYYLRKKQLEEAIHILQNTMAEPSLDSIWVKTLFWTHVAIPIKKTWTKEQIPDGDLHEYITYLNTLPNGVFWIEEIFNQLPNVQNLLTLHQETFWLQLLAALKLGEEEKAQELLNNNPFKYSSWEPELEKGLSLLLEFRQQMRNGSRQASASLFPRFSDIETSQELISLLANLAGTPANYLAAAVPYDLHDLLLSDEAFMLPFLAIGWKEAAIQLHALNTYPRSFPTWVAPALAEVLNQNRSPAVALDFARGQPLTPELALIISDLALTLRDRQTAFNALKNAYTANNVYGRRAALRLGQFLLENNNIQDAKKALLFHHSLVDDPEAQEMLARIAVEEGDDEIALNYYLKIEKQSEEAKSYLARKAFSDKDWPRARYLTQALLEHYPDNATLLENLNKIELEEQKGQLQNK